MTETREYVDFHAVPAHQAEIDRRLIEWGRAAHNGSSVPCAPMFRLYRSADPLRQYAMVSQGPIDTFAVSRIQKGVAALETDERLAISWCYIKRTNPARAARDIGTTLAGLKALIDGGRQTLIDRGL